MQNYAIKCLQCHVNKVEWFTITSLLYLLDIPNNKWEIRSIDVIVARLKHKEVATLYG